MKRITSIMAALAVAGMVLATGAAPVLASSIVTASQSTVAVSVGSSAYVSITSSGSQILYLASVINTNALNATLSGNQLIISGIAAGNGQIQVCAQDGGCAIISVTVGNVLGASVYNNGTLINDNGTIYITYKNNKIGFATWEAFANLGYKLSNVIQASTSALGTTSLPVYSSASAHPWGSWVRSGQTIYFVHDQGLIPIPTYDIFTNNGGNSSMIENINSYDLRMPTLSVMNYNDSRLR